MPALSVRPPLFEVGVGAEPDEEHLVIGVQQVEQESLERRLRVRELVARHAAAGVEHDAEAYRHALCVEVRDRLLLPVLEHDEVLLPEVGHEAPGPVRDGRRHVDQLDARAKAEALLRLLVAGRLPFAFFRAFLRALRRRRLLRSEH